MSPQVPQRGTFVVKEQTKKTTFPVHRADFGILRYTDTCEIWFDVAAESAIAGTMSSRGDESTPHMDATVYTGDVDVAQLSGRKFAIPAPSDVRQQPCSEAHLYDTGEDTDPGLLGPCTIHLGEQRDGIYPVLWKATLDRYTGTRPDDVIEIEVKADFALRGVKDVPCTLSYVSNRPFDRWMFILVPLCGLAGYVASLYTDWLNWWGGILAGVFVATWIARRIDYRWQERVHQLKFGGTPAGESISDDSAEANR